MSYVAGESPVLSALIGDMLRGGYHGHIVSSVKLIVESYTMAGYAHGQVLGSFSAREW